MKTLLLFFIFFVYVKTESIDLVTTHIKENGTKPYSQVELGSNFCLSGFDPSGEETLQKCEKRFTNILPYIHENHSLTHDHERFMTKYPNPVFLRNEKSLKCKDWTWRFLCDKGATIEPEWCGAHNTKLFLLKFRSASASYQNEISAFGRPILIDPDEAFHYMHDDDRMNRHRPPPRYVANHVFKKLASIGPTRVTCHFGQWPTTIIPKIFFLLKYTPNDVPILIPDCVKKFKEDMVRYGVWPKNRKFIVQKRDHLYKADELYSYFVPASHKVHRTTEFVPHLVQEMHEILLKSMKEKPQDYILIPLRNIHPDPSKDPEGGQLRKIENLSSLISRLKEEFPEYKIKTVAPHLLSNYYEQGRLFFNAKLIITPHSASESNLIWARKGTKIIEAQWEQFAAIQYYCLSRILGLEWGTVLSKSNYQVKTEMPVEDVILMAKKLLKKK